ncbi:hypothetical protein ZIOFF_042671 [Zingiber officinale]|uniref:Neprosin PEP catalytic domain-containing protein n=1 Tax=Zingiber officinale TaxID=94328 RepID=A0A8J5KNY9_ZINOF|nr:hypothetical protein ZIOFF_042671 [Zingiber officinale]
MDTLGIQFGRLGWAILIARASGFDQGTLNILAVRSFILVAQIGCLTLGQLKPSSLPNGLKLAKPKPATFYGFNDTCPSGTIPIERFQKSDYFRSHHPVDARSESGHYGDGYGNTGCANLRCRGFVRTTTSSIGPGSTVEKFSVYNGESIGYYPRELLPSMDGGIDKIQMGGYVFAPSSDPSPPMGSGHPYTEGRDYHVDPKDGCVFAYGGKGGFTK